jgi:hypothetical protein
MISPSKAYLNVNTMIDVDIHTNRDVDIEIAPFVGRSQA